MPVPVAHLTVRARDGIHLRLTPRDPQSDRNEGPTNDRRPAQPPPLQAWPYWLTLTFVPLVILAVIRRAAGPSC